MVDLKVIIGEYVSNASHDVYEDGSFVVFDAVKVTLVEPAKMKDQVLTLFINKGQEKDAIWQRKGSTVTFRVDEAFLKDNASLFTDALEDIQTK